MRAPSSAEKRAIKLLREQAVKEPPVPVEAMAKRLGAHITYEPFEGDVSGMLYRHDDHSLIGVNSTHAHTRQRFTVAHEVGHLLLHQGQPMFIDRGRVNWRDGTSDKEEIDANSFAAELLMPRDFVHTEIDRFVANRAQVSPQQLITGLAKRFKVSPEAMSYRLANVGILDPYSLAG